MVNISKPSYGRNAKTNYKLKPRNREKEDFYLYALPKEIRDYYLYEAIAPGNVETAYKIMVIEKRFTIADALAVLRDNAAKQTVKAYGPDHPQAFVE